MMAAILVLPFSIVLWSIFGAFTVQATGMGLIMDSAGVVNVSHTSGGKVSAVYIKTGQRIHGGDLIAQLEQAEQSADTRMAQYGMGLATSDRDALNRIYQYDGSRRIYLQRL